MKILIVSDDPSLPSGYGRMNAFICEALLKSGHTLALAAQHTREAGRTVFRFQDRDLPMYGFGMGSVMTESIKAICDAEQPDLVFTLCDWHGVKAMLRLQGTPHFMKWVHYAPVDAQILSPQIDRILAHIPYLVFMSPRYGDEATRDRRWGHVDYLPHAADPEIYKPSDRKGELREGLLQRFGWPPDAIIALTVARNIHRKQLPLIHEAASIIRNQSAPGLEKVRFLLHTQATDPEGWDLRAVARHFQVESLVAITDEPLPDPDLANLYAGCDLFLLPSMGEGFGIPVLEAVMCGLPVLTTGATATLDLSEVFGWAPLRPVTFWQHGLTIPRPLVPAAEIVRGLTDLLATRVSWEVRSESARKIAARDFSKTRFAERVNEILSNAHAHWVARTSGTLPFAAGRLKIAER